MYLYEVFGSGGTKVGQWKDAGDMLWFSQFVFLEIMSDEQRGNYVAVFPVATGSVRKFKIVGLLPGGGWGDTGYIIHKW